MGLSIFSRKQKHFILLLVVFTFLLKIALAAYFSYLGDCRNPELSVGYLAKSAGDTFSYIGSMENLIAEGKFYFWNGERKVYAGRMPYYGAPYFFFRLFFDKPLASDLLVLLQIFFDALATVFFALLCRNVLKRQAAFWIGYFLYFLNFNYFQSALLLVTESFSLSFMVLFFYAFHRYWSGENKSAVWSASIFLALACVLKPYLIPVYIAFLAVYAFRAHLFNFWTTRNLVSKTVFLSLSLALMIAPWFVRNLIVLNQPIVAQESMTAGYNYTKADFAFRRFVGGWGGDAAFWDAGSSACYFKLDPPFGCHFTLPSYSLATTYGAADIEDVRSDYLEFQRRPTPELEKTVVDKFDRLTEVYKNERPFMYYVGSGFLRIKTMLWHTNNYYLPIHASNPCFRSYQLLFKAAQFAVYVLALSLGMFGIIWLRLQHKISLLFPFVVVFLTIFFGFFVMFVEPRYFCHAYPIMLLGLAAVFFLMYSWVEKIIANKRKLN